MRIEQVNAPVTGYHADVSPYLAGNIIRARCVSSDWVFNEMIMPLAFGIFIIKTSQNDSFSRRRPRQSENTHRWYFFIPRMRSSKSPLAYVSWLRNLINLCPCNGCVVNLVRKRSATNICSLISSANRPCPWNKIHLNTIMFYRLIVNSW